MIWAIFRSLRLFWVSFVFAVTCLMWAGIMAGSFTRTDIQLSIMQHTSQYLQDHPEIMAWSLERMGYQTATLTPEETAVLPKNSLEALKARQRVVQSN